MAQIRFKTLDEEQKKSNKVRFKVLDENPNTINLPNSTRVDTKNFVNIPLYNKSTPVTDLSTPLSNPLPVRQKSVGENILDTVKTGLDTVGKINSTINKTLLSGVNYLGQGAMKGIEGIADANLQFSTSRYNPFMSPLARAYLMANPDKEKKIQNTADEITKRDLTKDLIAKLSGDENFNQNYLDKNSFIKENNLGGKVIAGVGQMMPAIATGNPTAGQFILGSQAFGGGVEEALQAGANRDQATLYGLGSAATEIATEFITGGIPGIKGSSGLDKYVAKGLGLSSIDEISGSMAKELIKSGYKIVGEGGEEALSEMIKPYLKNATYSKDEKISWSDVFESAIVGGITGGILEAPANITNIKSASQQSKANKNNIENTQNNVQDGSKVSEPTNNQVNTETIENEANTQEIEPNEIDDIQNSISPVERLEQYNQQRQNIKTQKQIQDTNNKVTDLQNRIDKLSDERNIFTQNNKIMSDLQNRAETLKVELNLPKVTTEGMTLQESAAKYNIAPNSETIVSLQDMYNKRGINSRFDASKFNDNNVNAIWYKDRNDNRSVVLNPNATTNDIIENLAVHELTHDIMSSEDSAKILNSKEILDYVKTIEGYNEARKNLEKTYSNMYNSNSENFQSLIDEEVVADVLGKKLGNQEFINRLVNSKPTMARRLYNWVVDKLNSLVNNGKVRNEKLYWSNVKNRFEKAYNMGYNNTNKSDFRYATVNNNPYGHIKEFVKMSQTKQEEAHRVISPLAAQYAGIEESYSATDINGNTYDFDIFEDGNYRVIRIEKLKDKSKEVAHGRNPNTNSRYSMASSEQQRNNNSINNQSNRSDGTSQQNVKIPTREQIESQNRISNQTQSGNNTELDNSSFSFDNQGRKLSKEQQIYFKDSKVRDKNGNLLTMYHGTPNDFTIFDTKNFGGANGTAEGFGIYLTDNIEIADDYLQNDKGKVMELYANITKPATTSELTVNKQDVIKAIKELTLKEAQEMVNDGDYDNINDALKDSWISNYTYTYDKSIEQSYNEVASTILDGSENDFEVLQELMNGSGNNDYKSTEDFYDIITNTLGFDGIQTKWDFKDTELKKKNANILIAFKPNQVKNIDNTNPTSDEDIRMSKENAEWNEWKNKNFKTEGTTHTLKDLKIPIKESKQTKSQIAPVPSVSNMQQSSKNKTVNIPKVEKKTDTKSTIPSVKSKDNTLKIKAERIAEEINRDGGLKFTQRSWVETSTESEILKDKVFIKDLDQSKINYVVQSNKKSLDKANDTLNKIGYDKAVEDVKKLINSDKLPNASDMALAQRILQEASKKGDVELVQDLIMDISILGTDLGQATQALSIIQKLTPEGQLKMYTKIINRAKTRGEKSFQDVEITPEMVQNVLEAYNEDGTYDQADLNSRVEKFKQDIADQLKTTTVEKIDAWRYLSMLGNPKTHIRNLVSNVGMKYTIKAKNALARTIETVAPIKNRTKTWKKASETVKNFANETATEMKDIITGDAKYNEKGSIEQKKQIFKNKTLEKISNFNSEALEHEDWLFSKSAFKSTLQEYLTANGISTQEDINNNPEIIEKGKQYAVQQAEIATFRQYSKLASTINSIERNHKIAGYAVKATLPFKKTPINVAKAGVNYSPIGLIKNISYDAYQLKIGNMEASQFIDNLSQGLTGTTLTLIGYALAKAGFLSGAGGADREDKYDSQLGSQSYALKVGGKTYSLSWLSPVAMPLLVGANAYEQLEKKEDWNMNVVSDTLAKTLDPLNEMSFLSGLTDAISSYGSGNDKLAAIGESAVQSYVAQFFPTIFSQLASTLDDTKRSTKPSSNSKWTFGEQTTRSIAYKIPFVRNKLEPVTDIWGNEKKQSSNILQRAFESFIMPYSKTEDISTELDKEIKKVYNETGDYSVIPSVPQAYTRYKNQTYRMSAKEYTKYKQTYGETASTELNKLMKQSSYKSANYDTKVKMISNVYDYARAVANEQYFNKNKIDYNSNVLNSVDKSGINAGVYYANKTYRNRGD